MAKMKEIGFTNVADDDIFEQDIREVYDVVKKLTETFHESRKQ